jgi:phosphoenolpyruvate phosphomutase
MNIVTYHEMANVVRDISQGCRLPIYVDADNGYGSDECALRALYFFAAAGATAVCVEDNAFPKRNSLYPDDRTLEDLDVFAQRISKLAAAGTGVQLIARTEALVAGYGAEEAVRRLDKYMTAGADAVFAQVNEKHAARLAELLARLNGKYPVVIAPTVLPDVTAEEFFSMGANVVIFANVVMRSCVTAVKRTLAALHKSGSLGEVAGEIASLAEIFRLTRDWGQDSQRSLRRGLAVNRPAGLAVKPPVGPA